MYSDAKLSFVDSRDRLKILERAVEHARNGIVITDPSLPDNPIIYANKSFYDLTGYSESEVVGKNCRFLQGLDQDQEELNLIKQAVRSETPCLCLLRNYRKDGTMFWNELSISPVHDDSGKCINFIGVQNDVTARKEAERRVSEFYSMVSHELRTPLSSIRASLGLIADGDAGQVSPAAARLVSIGLSNTERLLKLVEEILDLKKMESGKLDLKFEVIHPESIIDAVITELGQLAQNKHMQLRREIKTTKSFCADPTRVIQVLTNLVSNAIKFSPPDSNVLITAQQSGAHIRFEVVDEGIGIDNGDIGKLFVKFQQLDSSDTRPHSGSGLGLSICKMIVELHGGTIGVTSKPKIGSTFFFELPLIPEGMR